ncbi:MAG TPA: MBL fold metallo-hydrolase [Actinomycetota bacterium]|nr:MBL fold metallo-hydrolase [Actinomycetota bacterium]
MISERPFVAEPYPGIFRITMPIPFPGLDHVHVYAGEGESGGLVVIDTSLGWDDSLARLEEGLATMGRRTADIERVVLTHAHPDHVGLARVLQEASGAPVACHPIARTGFEGMQTPDRWQEITDHYSEHGRDPEDTRRHFMHLPLPDVFEDLEAGAVLRFAGGDWDVSWTPGHEHGHIAFHRRSDGLLMSGDTLLPSITPHVGYLIDPPDPLGMFMRSLDDLAALQPSIVLPGHGRVFTNGAERARATRSHHEQRLRRIIEVLARLGPLSAMDVSRQLFGRHLKFFQGRLALAETLAHLEHLRLGGQLSREKLDGVWRYEATRSATISPSRVGTTVDR